VHCSTISPEFNECSLFDELGPSFGPYPYRLRGLDRAARPHELKYKYVTGEAIGLEGGLELTRVGPAK